MKKKIIITSLCCIFFIAALLSPLGQYGISVSVMKIYSMENETQSLLADKNIDIKMCTGDGWYPFVMTFNADEGFGNFIGDDDIRLTILYNFPEFDLKKGCSRIYDDTSPYYNGFYGAYAVSGRYGFDESGNIDENTISKVPEYDFTKLVLRDLGMPSKDAIFSWQITGTGSCEKFAGSDGWTVIDANMKTNGVLHSKKEYLQNYIQYGMPGYDSVVDFAPVDMVGRIYGKYFEEYDLSIFFYVMVRDEALLEACDRDILSKSVIEMN